MKPMKVLQSSRRDGASCRVKGTDFLTAVTIGGTAASAGDVLVSQVVNPRSLGIARLATMSQLYERYKFRSLKFRYSPVSNATINGQIIGYVDYDTYDDPTGLTGLQNLQKAASHYGEKPVQIWQGSEKPVYWEIKDVDPMTDLYVDSDGSDNRWTNQGRFVLLAASAIAGSTPCGNIYLDYDIEFFIPQLELTPLNGYASAFTCSSSGCSSTAILGTGVSKSWNNLPITISNNIISMPQGNYLLAWHFTGTGHGTLTATPSGTAVYNLGSVVDSAATSVAGLMSCYSTTPQTVTFSCNSTTISAGSLYIALLPTTATTLSQRQYSVFLRAIKTLESASSLRQEIDSSSRSSSHDSKESKTKEEKELERVVVSKPPLLTRAYSSMSSSSTSSCSSSSFGSLDRVDEEYVRVIRKS